MVSVAPLALLVFLARTADATVWPTDLNLPRFNLRTFNHRSNTLDGGRDTKTETVGSCTALIADEWKLFRLTQDRRQKRDFSYALHHLPDMVGKLLPRSALIEHYYGDTSGNRVKKQTLINELEALMRGQNSR